MAYEKMNGSQIDHQLNELVGETGNAKVKNGGLYVQREENADWIFIGSVEDEAEAKQTVNEYFNQ